MNNNDSNFEMVSVEMSVLDWKTFNKVLYDLKDDLSSRIINFSDSVYIPIANVDQRENFKKHRDEIMNSIEELKMLEGLMEKIVRKIKIALTLKGLPQIKRRWDYSRVVRNLERIIANQAYCSLTIDDLGKEGMEKSYGVYQETPLYEGDNIIDPELFGSGGADNRITIGVKIRILSQEDLDTLNAEIKKIKKERYKEKSLRAAFNMEKLTIEIPAKFEKFLKK